MYDTFGSIAAAKQRYRRCRTTKSFILTEEAIQREKPTCAVCGQPMTGLPKGETEVQRGYSDHCANRCEYLPKTKKVAVMHYICAWTSLLNKVAQMHCV
jgi:hypothetical protein